MHSVKSQHAQHLTSTVNTNKRTDGQTDVAKRIIFLACCTFDRFMIHFQPVWRWLPQSCRVRSWTGEGNMRQTFPQIPLQKGTGNFSQHEILQLDSTIWLASSDTSAAFACTDLCWIFLRYLFSFQSIVLISERTPYMDLFLATGDTWRRLRRIATPTFTTNKMKQVSKSNENSCLPSKQYSMIITWRASRENRP